MAQPELHGGISKHSRCEQLMNLGERYTELHCIILPTLMNVQNSSKTKSEKKQQNSTEAIVEVNRLEMKRAGRNTLKG